MTRINYLPLVLLIILLPVVAAAEMYQWVDEKGVRHFSNEPPPTGTRAESYYEIKSRDTEAQSRQEREAAIIKETEAANQQREIDAAAAKEKKARQDAIDAKKAEKEALGESISKKRRYIKRRGKTDINKLKRIDQELEALRKDPNADPEKIKALEEEYQETKDKFIYKSGRGRKGTKEEIKRYQELEQEIEKLEK